MEDTEDGTAEAAVAGQYVVVNMLVTSSVTPTEFVTVETTTPVSVVRLRRLEKEDLIDAVIDAEAEDTSAVSILLKKLDEDSGIIPVEMEVATYDAFQPNDGATPDDSDTKDA